MILRPYQLAAIDQAIAALDRNPCIVAPTGAGKTTIGTELVKRIGRPTLWLAHRRELIGQAAARLRQSGLSVGVIMAGEPKFAACPVQVASIQTLARRKQIPDAEIVVLDECHHVAGESFLKILSYYPNAHRVGLTATPFRLDGKGLGDVFGELVIAAYPDELCGDGTLIEPRVYAPATASLKGVHIKRGDFVTGELAAAVDKPKLIGDVVATWQKYAAGRRTVLFAVNVQHSQHLIEAFVAAGVKAEHIDGTTPKPARAAALARLAAGETLVLSNCAVLTEGWDLPALEVAIVARPTASLCLHLQMIGRIMRSCDGKDGAIVLDHAGNFLRHGRVTQRLEYSLAGTVRKSSESTGTGLKTCKACFRMVLASRKQCPECGAELTGQTELPEHEAGELVELPASEIPVATPEEREEYWTLLREEARQTDRKPGWVAYRFKERWGFWPVTVEYRGLEVYVDPKTPDPVLKLAVLERFQAEQSARGYKEKYAACRFKEIFGEWPRTRMFFREQVTA